VACELIEDPAAVRLLIAAQVGPVRLIDNCVGIAVAQPTPLAATGRGARSGRPGRRLEKVG
jgi:hypothetical protein